MKSLINKLKTVLVAPIKITWWLFKHNPFFTAAELFALSVIHVILLHIINFIHIENMSPAFINVAGGVLGFMSVIFSSFIINNRNEVENFEVNNYDVLSLTVNEYLSSRGIGILMSYFFGGVIAFVLAVLIAITVMLWGLSSMLFGK